MARPVPVRSTTSVGAASRTAACSKPSRCARTSPATHSTGPIDDNRVGDHIWWIGDNSRFAEHHPTWKLTYDVPTILTEMHDANRQRWS